MSLPGAVYRRRRLGAALVVVFAAAALLLAMHGLRPSLAESDRPWAPSGVYVVQAGDTFWDIAGRLQPGRDPRPLVAQLVAAHGSTVLLPGDRIALPAAA